MRNKTVDELRALARSRGLSGYSKLRKDQLLTLLETKSASGRGKSPAARARASKTKAKAPRKAKTAKPSVTAAATPPRRSAAAQAGRRRPVASTPGEKARIMQKVEIAQVTAQPGIDTRDRSRTPTRDLAENPVWPPGWWQPSTPEPVAIAERAKYAVGPATVKRADRLEEDIERLPALRRPMLMLLPQKPGVLHAYWSLSAGTDTRALRLRLCRVVGGLSEVLSEIALSSSQGNFYFRLDTEMFAGDALVELGEYRDGVFVARMQRGLPRLPLRRTAPAYWLSAALFRRRYTETALGSSGAFQSTTDVISSR